MISTLKWLWDRGSSTNTVELDKQHRNKTENSWETEARDGISL